MMTKSLVRRAEWEDFPRAVPEVGEEFSSSIRLSFCPHFPPSVLRSIYRHFPIQDFHASSNNMLTLPSSATRSVYFVERAFDCRAIVTYWLLILLREFTVRFYSFVILRLRRTTRFKICLSLSRLRPVLRDNGKRLKLSAISLGSRVFVLLIFIF